ncbi:MAG TPA: tetratricopeptide repeat protein [Bryobacteraceae bacterium]|nr:tetratricopeptide repeat protein [Bryobacteraceae bacterium]
MRAQLACLLAFALGSAFAADFATGLKAYEGHDYNAAFNEWKPIADSGDPNAQFNIGLMYFDGKGVPQDFEKAVEWFRRAANQGYAKAQKNLGEMYYSGKGVKRDYVQAYVWLSVCAASGDQNCVDHRDIVAGKLNAGKLSTAQRQARDWKPIKEGAH